MCNNSKFLVVAAPSGSGKSTLVSHLMSRFPAFAFSISATSRPPRGQEQNGREYHFYSSDAFQELVNQDAFIEWEEVYPGRFYGTLKSEVDRIQCDGRIPLFDVDVKGALNIKKLYGERAVTVFIQPPSLSTLRERLESRGTDSAADIEERLRRAAQELTYAPKFDFTVVNDNLAQAQEDIVRVVSTAVVS